MITLNDIGIGDITVSQLLAVLFWILWAQVMWIYYYAHRVIDLRKGSFRTFWFGVALFATNLFTMIYVENTYAADTKITDLTATSAAVGTQELPTNDSGTDRKITLAQIKTFAGGTSLYKLSSDYTNATTTGTEVTGIGPMTISAAGTYHLDCRLMVEGAATTASPKFGVNYTGTVTRMAVNARFPSQGVTAATGTIEDVVNATTGQVWAHAAAVTESTTAPNLGPWVGVAAANSPILFHVEAIITVSDTGDIELWAGSDEATTITIRTGSLCLVR